MSGPFGAGSLNLFSGAKEFYPYEIDHSLRMDDGSGAYLQKNFSGLSGGNRRTFTISFWFKRAYLDEGKYLFAGGDDTSNRFHMDINTSGTFQIEAKSGGSTQIKMEGGPVLRDTQSWYHFVLRVDTTQGTASDRVRLYVNGDLLTFNSNTYPSQNADLNWNINDQVRIGRAGWATSYFDGYFAEFINVDGSSLAPTEFGETKEGIWIPKDPSGLTYGTYGFKLSFQDSSNLGDDTSGNGNDFTANNLGAHDQVEDTPTNNFMTYNNLLATDYGTRLYEGNMWFNTGGTGGPPYKYSSAGTFAGSSAVGGKYYWEWYCKESGLGAVGIYDVDVSWNGYSRMGSTGPVVYYSGDGKFANQAARVTYGNSFTDGDIIGCAVDFDNRKIWFSKNGTWQNSGDPAAGTNAAGTFAEGVYYLGYIEDLSPTNISKVVLNAGQDGTFAGEQTSQGNSDGNGVGDFYYSPPSGFLAVCSKNWPDPGVNPNADENAGDHFNTVLYTGNSATAQSITGVGFQPDFLWFKQRSRADEHALFDVVRGAGDYIRSNRANAEGTDATGLTSFDSDGFSLGTDGAGWLNQGSDSMISWAWKAGGTASSNTDGSITSSVSANPDAGISILTYTGTGTDDASVGHGLGKAPSLIMVKRLDDTNDWVVKSTVTGWNNRHLRLNAADALFTSGFNVGTLAPTSSVFYIGNDNRMGANTYNYVAYCFAEIEGFSKFGTYTGGGSTFNPYVWCGFRPAFVLFKQHSAARNWEIKDTARDPFNDGKTGTIYANTNSAEYTPGTRDADSVDFLSNGFKFRSSAPGSQNVSGGEYLFMAFAEQPFKYSNAR